jgi:hypothetical protein
MKNVSSPTGTEFPGGKSPYSGHGTGHRETFCIVSILIIYPKFGYGLTEAQQREQTRGSDLRTFVFPHRFRSLSILFGRYVASILMEKATTRAVYRLQRESLE